MKQKNLILMVVAVGCGLVAALLTSQMSARQTKVDTVDVIVAAKDLPVGTMITKEDLPKMVKMRKIPKDALPPAFVQSEEEMIDKRLARGVRMDEWFNPADMSKGGTITLPKGMDMISLAVGLSEAVAGFVTPGSRVDILASMNAGRRQVAFPLLVNMLVLAVDNQTALPKDQATFAALNTVSLAVDRKQALLIQLARTRGCALSLVLRHPDKQDDDSWKPEQVLQLLQNPDAGGGDGIAGGNTQAPPPEKGPATPTKPSSETVKLPVATEDIAAGTDLTEDVLKKFAIKEIPSAELPPNAVLDLETVQGKVLQHGIAANQWLPKGFVVSFAGGKDTPKNEFRPELKDEQNGPPPLVQGPAVKIHDIVVVTGSGHKIFRYHEKTPGEWVLVGEVTKGHDQPNAASGDKPWTPAPTPSPEPKPEPVPPTASPKID
jgi:pilus assembly protein CpaB